VEELKIRHIEEEKELAKLSQRVTARDDELIGRISGNWNISNCIAVRFMIPMYIPFIGSLDWRTARKEVNHTKELDNELIAELPMYRSIAAVETDAFSLQGSATVHTASCGSSSFEVAKECIQVTPARTSQTGSAFSRNKVSLERHEGIVIDFAFKIASENDGKANGADGIAFVIQSFSENALGSGKDDCRSGVPP
jgi:Bacterial lectin